MNLKRGHRFVVSIFVVLATLYYSVSPLTSPGINTRSAEAGWYSNDINWRYKQKFTITNPGAETTDALVALRDEESVRYSLDEGSGTVVADTSGADTNKDLAITGLDSGISWSESGKYGSGLTFDGTTTNYLSGSGPGLINEGSASFSLWVKTSSSNEMMLLNSYVVDGEGYGFFLEINSGYLRFRTTQFGGGSQHLDIISSSTAVNDNAWHMVTVVLDSGSKNAAIYVDGQIENISKSGGSCGTINAATVLQYSGCDGLTVRSDLYVGYGYSDGYVETNPFIGTLDEIRIYETSFSASQIEYLYDNNASPIIGSSIYSNTKEDGSDIRFTLSDGSTSLPFKFVGYSASGQYADIWIQIPTLPSGDTDIYMYYGNPSANGIAAGDFAITDGGGDPVATGNLIVSGALDTRYNGVWTPTGTYNNHDVYTYNSLYLWNDYAQDGPQSNAWMFGQPGVGPHDVAFSFIPGEGTAYYNARPQIDAELIATYFPAYYPDWNTDWDTFADPQYTGPGPTTSYEITTPPPSYLSYFASYRNGEPIEYQPFLSFTVEGVTSGVTHNGVTTNVNSDNDFIHYGKLEMSTVKYAAQKLTVDTNAVNGYTVTVKIDGYLQGLYPANKIDPFGAPNASWSTPQLWSSPNGSVANTDSGWVGANTSDTRVAGWDNASAKFGPISTTAHTVMTGNDMDSSATVYVSYAIEINAMQVPDSYAGTMIYNIIPVY